MTLDAIGWTILIFGWVLYFLGHTVLALLFFSVASWIFVFNFGRDYQRDRND